MKQPNPQPTPPIRHDIAPRETYFPMYDGYNANMAADCYLPLRWVAVLEKIE